MDRRRIAKWALALALTGTTGSVARAGAVTFTGNVGADMPTNAAGVITVPGEQPAAVAQPSWVTQSGWVNGWVIKDVRLDYNQATDTMQVGVNFYSIAGDPSGNPSGSDPRVQAAGGAAPANLGGTDSITVEFAVPNTAKGQAGQPGSAVVVAGVPEAKSSSDTGTDHFTVATPLGNSPSMAIESNYGTQINSAMGNLAFDPSPAHPDFEFTVKNWSQFAALNGSGGFWVSAYAGSLDDAEFGKGSVNWFHVPTPAQQVVNPTTPPPPAPSVTPTVPEPTTFAGWSLLIAGGAWALCRSRMATTRV